MEDFIEYYDDKLVVNSPEDHPIEDWIKKLDGDELENEKGNYINFFTIILERLLGYELEDIGYEEDINEEGRPVEFTFKKGDKDYVVVELKGTKTKDLNKRYNRAQSAIDQVTNYASGKEETKWAFVSNYNEFRIFKPSYRKKYISFKFKELTDENVLKKFLLIFSKFSLIEKDIPQTLLNQSIIMERNLEDQFYQLFSETRLMLIKELEYEMDFDKNKAIYYAQLILNRYIFICFAEDLKLVRSETTTNTLITPIKQDNIFDSILWERLNELFKFVYKGNPNKKIKEFNCSLFEENLENLRIRDTVENPVEFFKDCYQNWNFDGNDRYESIGGILGDYKDKLNPIFKNLLIVSSFDFGSELDVNILGHIFENSIGDIEDLKNQSNSRRKKDGIFYTPSEITDYICRNTIIPYLSLSGEVNTINDLIEEYEVHNKLEELDNKLKNIKIIDPACGSGAFLNKAVDILLDIHKTLFDSLYYNDSTLIPFFDSLNSRKQIMTNNIYGVDVNEESVQITKLSLFLKLATSSNIESGFELPDLDKNIKCGDSLVNDKNVVGNKAFNWKEEFKEVFNSGGFDIIVGNPPYVDIKNMDDKVSKYLFEEYDTSVNRINLYSLFIEKSTNIIKDSGYFGFIIPNSILFNSSYEKIRIRLLEDTSITQILKLTDDIFEDAEVETIILIFKNKINKENKTMIKIYENKNYFNSFTRNQQIWLNDSKHIIQIYSNDDSVKLIKKIEQNHFKLEDLCDFSLGLTPYDKYKGMSAEDIKNKVFHSNEKLTDDYKELLGGSDVTRYNVAWHDGQYIKYGPWLAAPREEKFFKKPRILVRQIISKEGEIIAGYTDKEYYNAQVIFNIILKDESNDINLKYILGIFNSKLMNFYHREKFLDQKKTKFPKILIENTKIFPIAFKKDSQKELTNLVEEIIHYSSKLEEESYNFKYWLNYEFGIGKISARNKLFNFWKLNEKDFLIAFKRKSKNINSKQLSNLKNEFFKSQNKCLEYNNNIISISKSIDNLVYSLYDLTHEEIETIENSLKIN